MKNEKLHDKCNRLKKELEEAVESILSDIDVNLDVDDIEDWHRVGKSDSKTKSKKEPL